MLHFQRLNGFKAALFIIITCRSLTCFGTIACWEFWFLRTNLRFLEKMPLKLCWHKFSVLIVPLSLTLCLFGLDQVFNEKMVVNQEVSIFIGKHVIFKTVSSLLWYISAHFMLFSSNKTYPKISADFLLS